MPGLHQASIEIQSALVAKKTEIPDNTSSHTEAASQRDVMSSYSGQASKNFIPDRSKVYYFKNISNK